MLVAVPPRLRPAGLNGDKAILVRGGQGFAGGEVFGGGRAWHEAFEGGRSFRLAHAGERLGGGIKALQVASFPGEQRLEGRDPFAIKADGGDERVVRLAGEPMVVS